MNRKKLTFSIFVIIISMVSCNLEFSTSTELPTLKELKLKSTLENEVNNLITQNKELFSNEYSISPNATLNYLNGKKNEIHYVSFNCYNENLNNLERPKLDSVSKVLAKVILNNIENDTSFSFIVIEMIKQENSTFKQQEWTYAKDFEINELKK